MPTGCLSLISCKNALFPNFDLAFCAPHNKLGSALRCYRHLAFPPFTFSAVPYQARPFFYGRSRSLNSAIVSTSADS